MMVGFRAASGRKLEWRAEWWLLQNLSQTFWSDRILRLLRCHLRFISASCHAAEMSTLKNATMTCLFRILMLPYYGNFTLRVFSNYNLCHSVVCHELPEMWTAASVISPSQHKVKTKCLFAWCCKNFSVVWRSSQNLCIIDCTGSFLMQVSTRGRYFFMVLIP